MFRKRPWFCQCSFVAALTHITVHAGAMACYGNIVLPPNGSWATIEDASPIGQSFTAERSRYQRVGLWLEDINRSYAPTDFTIDYHLYSGVGTSGALLRSQSMIVPHAGYSGFLDVEVSDIEFVIGGAYSLVAMQDTPRWAVGVGFESYSGGTRIHQGHPVDGTGNAGFHAVPEPSAAILFLMISWVLLALRAPVTLSR
jgi:hypothetical protein